MIAITTVDNPYDPFDEYEEWLQFDMMKGYNSCGLLAKIARTSDEFSDELNEEIIEQAIDEIVEEFNGTFYKKMTRE